MIHTGIDMVGIEHYRVAGYTLNIGDKTDSTGVFFVSRVVQTNLVWKSAYFHHAIANNLFEYSYLHPIYLGDSNPP